MGGWVCVAFWVWVDVGFDVTVGLMVRTGFGGGFRFCNVFDGAFQLCGEFQVDCGFVYDSGIQLHFAFVDGGFVYQ